MTHDDAVLYWLTGNAISDGTYIFYASEGTSVIRQRLIRPPVYSLLLFISGTLFGPRIVSMFLPTIISGILLPIPMFFVFRNLDIDPFKAFTATALLLLFPPFQLRSLSPALPHPVALLLLVTALYYATELMQSGTRVDQLIFGVVGGLTLLTRPEGLVYIGSLGLMVTVARRSIPWYAVGITGVFASIWVGISWRVTGLLWYSTRKSSGYQLSNLLDLVTIMSRNTKGYLSLVAVPLAIGVITILVVCVLIGAGTIYVAQRDQAYLLLFLPLFMNISVLWLLPPKSTYLHLPYGFAQQHTFVVLFLAVLAGAGWQYISTLYQADAWLVRSAAYLQSAVWTLILIVPSRTALLLNKQPYSIVDLLLHNVAYYTPLKYRLVDGIRTLPGGGPSEQYYAWKTNLQNTLGQPSPFVTDGAVLLVGLLLLGVFLQYEWSVRNTKCQR